MKDLIRKILRESEDDDFSWVPEGDIPLGDKFEESQVCFNPTSVADCDINITSDEITIKIELEEWTNYFANAGDDGHYVLRSLLFNYNYRDYDEVDSDEFNYILHYLDNENRTKINEILGMIGIDDDVESYRDQMYKLFEIFEDFKPISRLVDDVLYSIGVAITDSRQYNLENEFNDIKKSLPFDIDGYRAGYRYRDSGDYVIITIPVDKFFELLSDGSNLTQAIKKYSSYFDLNWDDVYYGDYDAGNATDEINEYVAGYLSDLVDEIESTDTSIFDEYKKFKLLLKNLDFRSVGANVWKKHIYKDNLHIVLQIKNVSLEEQKFNLNVIVYEDDVYKKNTEYRLNLDQLGDFVYNYKLDL